MFCWLRSHIGIRGNERADSSAKAALGKKINVVKLYTKMSANTLASMLLDYGRWIGTNK